MNGCNNKTQNIPKTRVLPDTESEVLFIMDQFLKRSWICVHLIAEFKLREWGTGSSGAGFPAFCKGKAWWRQFLILDLIFLSQWWGQRWAEASWTPWPHSVLSVVSSGVLPVPLRRQALGLCDRSPYMELPQGSPPLLATDHFLESAALTWNASQLMGV